MSLSGLRGRLGGHMGLAAISANRKGVDRLRRSGKALAVEGRL
jgi:hypothetical protein